MKRFPSFLLVIFLILLTSIIYAYKHPLQLGASLPPDRSRQKGELARIAIIGTGLSGSCAAHELKELANRSTTPIEITVFEKDSRIGGQIQSIESPIEDERPLEAGAAGFFWNDRNILKVAEDVGLSPRPYFGVNETGRKWSEWDGTSFQPLDLTWNITLSPRSQGIHPRWPTSLPSQMKLKALVDYCQRQDFPDMNSTYFDDILDIFFEMDLLEDSQTSAKSFLVEIMMMNETYVTQVVQPFVKSRLNADLDDVSAFAAFRAIATADLLTFDEGLMELPRRLLERSEATVLLDTKVTRMTQSRNDTWFIEHVNTSNPRSSSVIRDAFDYAILTPSLRCEDIQVEQYLTDRGWFEIEETLRSPQGGPPDRHVTLFQTSRPLNGSFFGVVDAQIPHNIVTTNDKVSGPSQIISITSPEQRYCTSNDPPECIDQLIYRIVSVSEITDETIANLIDYESSSKSLSDIGVDWIHRHKWEDVFARYGGTGSDPRIARGLYYKAIFNRIANSLDISCGVGRKLARQLFAKGVIDLERSESEGYFMGVTCEYPLYDSDMVDGQ